MEQNLIIVKQLPVIEEKLKKVSEAVEQKINKTLSLVCDEETVKTIKMVRAELNKEFCYLEAERKNAKAKVMEPYEQFESVYKEYIADKYTAADKILKQRIKEVEDRLKDEKREEIKAYFNEYLTSKNIDFINFEQSGIKITLSQSMKSLKKDAKDFIDRICDDLVLIQTQEYKDEILFEYKKTLNVTDAFSAVTERQKALAKAKEIIDDSKSDEQDVVEKVDALLAPKIEEPEFTLTFTVTATKDKLIRLKQFLIEGGYQYE